MPIHEMASVMRLDGGDETSRPLEVVLGNGRITVRLTAADSASSAEGASSTARATSHEWQALAPDLAAVSGGGISVVKAYLVLSSEMLVVSAQRTGL
ncbi:hypothetical protein H4219_001299 [Mycoemilia scoparia]|uniref:Uncharacterized protein n=1 Tax=Mycoemilia scoparia TaxID=417184 RepID=A0A9W8DVX2_9FUNG|nr:hypothetical protein H4219_001299 [Mycoemilia scoparia]